MRAPPQKRPSSDENRDVSSSDAEESDEYQFGVWLRHRRIDGALNRVPAAFYAVSVRRLARRCNLRRL